MSLYCVVGLGLSGWSAVEFLRRRSLPVAVTDSAANPSRAEKLRHFYPDVVAHFGALSIPAETTHVIISPGVPLDHPVIKRAREHCPVWSDIELYAQHTTCPVVAVTGTNGKSTIVSLLAQMAVNAGLRVGLGGNIGTPALSLLEEARDLDVLELSSYQLEAVYSLQPTAACICNITEDHLVRHKTMAAYIAAKLRIYHNAQFCVANRLDPATLPPQPQFSPWTSIGLDAPAEKLWGVITHQRQPWLAEGSQPLLPVSRLQLLGQHNVFNALAALALGRQVGLDTAAMLKTLLQFKGLPHRMEKVAQQSDVLWVNDSKATNLGATLSALQGLSGIIRGRWIIILGGQPKTSDFSPLVAAVRQHCRAVIALGEAAPAVAHCLKAVVPCHQVDSMQAAVVLAQNLAQAYDGVLLSPACASFDMFENFQARGDKFKNLVLETLSGAYLPN